MEDVNSLEDSDVGYHSTEHGEMINKETCTHLGYIRDFQRIKFAPGWERAAALSFLDWMQSREFDGVN